MQEEVEEPEGRPAGKDPQPRHAEHPGVRCAGSVLLAGKQLAGGRAQQEDSGDRIGRKHDPVREQVVLDVDDREPDCHHEEIGAGGQGKPEGQRVGGAQGAEKFDHSRMLLDIRPARRPPRVNCGYGRMGQHEPAWAGRATRSGGEGRGLPEPVRSSPWKWQSLRFEYLDRPLTVSAGSPTAAASPDDLVRGWLRRPGALRLETAGGLVIGSTTGINDSRGGFYVSSTRKTWSCRRTWSPRFDDDDGLVRRRPEAAYGEPSFGNGRFAAVLDPVELAGNAPVPLEFPNANAVELGRHHGGGRTRGGPPWRPRSARTPASAPADPGSAAVPSRPRGGRGSSAGTGVCVASRWLDAPGAGNEQNGYGHWLRILGVDEYMLDDLFLAESIEPHGRPAAHQLGTSRPA